MIDKKCILSCFFGNSALHFQGNKRLDMIVRGFFFFSGEETTEQKIKCDT